MENQSKAHCGNGLMLDSISRQYHQKLSVTFYKQAFRFSLLSPIILGCLLTGCNSIKVGIETNSEQKFVDQLNTYILQTISQRHVPGLAVGIVKDGQVILSRGYGTLNVDNRSPVNAQTVFSIGSLTKSFTSELAGILVDEHKIGFDQPIRDVAPDFQLSEPDSTARVTFRDLLAHKSGLPDLHNLFLYGNDLPSSKIFKGLKSLPLVSHDERTFHYSNEGYTAVGEALVEAANKDKSIPKDTKNTFDSLLVERVVKPLGMKNTTFFKPSAAQSDNVSASHILNADRSRAVVVEAVCLENQIAAAGLYSNVDDLCQWIKLQLADGSINNHQLISQNGMREVQTAVVPLSQSRSERVEDEGHKKTTLKSAMGWFVTSTHNCKMLFNQGDLLGAKSLITLLPEKKVGFVILSNLSENSAVLAIQHRILDHYTYVEEPEKQWLEQLNDADIKAYQKHDAAFNLPIKKNAVYGANKNLQADLTAKALGHYHSDALGDIYITALNGNLQLKYGHRLISHMVPLETDSKEVLKFKAFFNFPTVWPAMIEFKAFKNGFYNLIRVGDLAEFRRI